MLALFSKLAGLFVRVVALLALLVGARITAALMAWPAWTTLALTAGVVLIYFTIRSWLRALGLRREEFRLGGGVAMPDTDPELAARMRLSWKTGTAFLDKSHGDGPAARSLPWFVMLDTAAESGFSPLDAAETVAGPEHAHPGLEFNWRFAHNAVWIDYSHRNDACDQERWRLFCKELATAPNSRLAGVAVTVRAADLLGERCREHAAGLRRRLDLLIRGVGVRLPIYLLVDGIEALYGMRSALSVLPESVVDQPCGGFRLDEKTPPGRFAESVVERATADLQAAVACSQLSPASDYAFSASAEPAAIRQAPEELARLGQPLGRFCHDTFGYSPYHYSPLLRGIFLGSSGPDGTALPPLLASQPHFQPAIEPAPRPGWFYRVLLDSFLAADPAPKPPVRQLRHAHALSTHAGLVGLLAGLLLVSWLFTGTFLRSRSLLLSVADSVAAPEAEEHLRELLGDTLRVEKAVRNSLLPGMGLDRGGDLLAAMRRRYCEAYTRLVLDDQLRDMGRKAVFALSEENAAATGDTLLSLSGMRRGLVQVADGTYAAEAAPDTVSRPNIFRECYLSWAEPDSWMLEVAEQLHYLEARVLGEAWEGDPARWLPDWVDRLPGLTPVDVASVWDSTMPAGQRPGALSIRPAWTAAGYRQAVRLLDNLLADHPDESLRNKRDTVLAGYRTQALAAWREAARRLWPKEHDAIRDADVLPLLQRLAAGDGPAVRLASLLNLHLAPMFEGVRNDDIDWMRRYAALAAATEPAPAQSVLDRLADTATNAVRRLDRETGLDALSRDFESGLQSAGDGEVASLLSSVAESLSSRGRAVELMRRAYGREKSPLVTPLPGANPLIDAEAAVPRMERRLIGAGAAPWREDTPTAEIDSFRRLAVRLAAWHVDAAWREEVYQPAAIMGDCDEDLLAQLTARNGYLAEFLKGTVQGLWRMTNGKMERAVWDGLEFPFASDFLSYCETLMSRNRVRRPAAVMLTVGMRSVNVSPGAKEVPETVDLVWTNADKEERLSYRNFAAEKQLRWSMGDDISARLEIRFPSRLFSVAFTGRREVGRFIERLSTGRLTLTPDDFPRDGAALGRLGVTEIAVRADVRNGEEFVSHAMREYGKMPSSIIRAAGPVDTAYKLDEIDEANEADTVPMRDEPVVVPTKPALPIHRVEWEPEPEREAVTERIQAMAPGVGNLRAIRVGGQGRRGTYFNWFRSGR